MRVNELAKQLGIPTQKLVNKIKRMKISVTSAVSILNDKDAARIKKEIKVPIHAKAAPKKASAKKTPARKKAVKPKAAALKKTVKKAKAPLKKAVKARPVTVAPSQIRMVEPPRKIAPIRPQKRPIKKKIEEKAKPEAAPPSVVVSPLSSIELSFPITVKELSVRLQIKPSILIKKLIELKVMAGLNQSLTEDVVKDVCGGLGVQIKEAPKHEDVILKVHKQEDDPASLLPRFAVVILMGHVDHGKTSLLDMIRESKIVDREHGGITQHIGAYQVAVKGGKVTFLDTPGHEAFTLMRARGAHITDIVILVVAADDGVMPQTQEAIDHAKAAGAPIVVAINKIDKAPTNIDKVKKQLSELGLLAEDWGGKTITVGVSAKTGEGIDNLLEMILLEAEMLELKANPNRPARGVVVEARMSKGSGPVATLLVQNGTLNINDSLIIGSNFGKIKAMSDADRKRIDSAGPSVPVEVFGLSGVPEAGEEFFVVESEKKARELAAARAEDVRQQAEPAKKISLNELCDQIKEGRVKELRIVLKADVQGSLEAIVASLEKIDSKEVQLNFLHTGIGAINSSDVILASVSNALILGFHVKPDAQALEKIAKEGVEVRTYNVIYELIDELKSALEGMLEPKLKRVFMGRVQVKKVFKVSKSGIVAGGQVTKGTVSRSGIASVVRNGESIHEGPLSSLKRFKDDVKEVKEGFECGITVSGFSDYKEGDIIEVYEEQKIVRKL